VVVRLNTERNTWKQLSSLMSLFIGLFTTLLAASFASSQTATTAGQAGSGPEGSAQEQSSSGSGSDTDSEIIQELERMRNRIQQLESELKQRHTANSAVTDAGKPVSAKAQQLVSGSEASTELAVQTESPAAGAKPEKAEPFAFADWTWLNGNPRTKEPAFDSKFFTPEVRTDVAYHYDFNHPQDDTISGSSEVFRSNEISLTHLGIGGDFHYDHVRARVFSQ
jgi:TolA-binding protein